MRPVRTKAGCATAKLRCRRSSIARRWLGRRCWRVRGRKWREEWPRAAAVAQRLHSQLPSRSAGRSQGRRQPASFASEPCVPSMFDSWRGESPRTNLMEVKDSDAQGLPSREMGSEGSA